MAHSRPTNSSLSRAADNAARIHRTSTMLVHLFTLLAVLVPVAAAVFWFAVPAGSKLMPYVLNDLPIVLTPASRLSAFAITLLPGGVMVWSFLILRRLFGLYARGEFFTRANVRCFRQLGLAALSWTVANLVYSGLLSAALTLSNPPGQRAVAISASGVDVTALFAGIALLVVSWVMDEARRIEEEQSQII